jgi:tetratricopeptide (TPR) repeat protein
MDTAASYRDLVKKMISDKRQAVGLTKLSEETGVPHPRLVAYEKGDDLPSDANLRKLESVFGESLGEAVRQAREEPYKPQQPMRGIPDSDLGFGSYPKIAKVSLNHKGCPWNGSRTKKALRDAGLDESRERERLDEIERLGRDDRARCRICYSIVLRRLSFLAVNQNDLERADNAFHRAMDELLPEHSDAAVAHAETIAVHLADHVSPGSALPRINFALAKLLHAGILWRRLGILHWQLGNLTEAYAVLQYSTKKIDSIYVAYPVGLVLLELDKMSDAINQLSRVIEQSSGGPVSVSARCARAFALAHTNSREATARDFDQAEQATAPGDSDDWLYYFQGRVHERDKNTGQAVQCFARVGGGRSTLPERLREDAQRRLRELTEDGG